MKEETIGASARVVVEEPAVRVDTDGRLPVPSELLEGDVVQGEHIQREPQPTCSGSPRAELGRQCRTASVADEPSMSTGISSGREARMVSTRRASARASLMHGARRRLELAHADLGKKAIVPDVHPHEGVRRNCDPNAADEIGVTRSAGLFGGIETAVSGTVLPNVDVDARHCSWS